ncbi:EF-hand domain [Trypanosoma melophagium]|uniref:EF-hand domain n=1 Tax=Trypanosoma melophagium TaxID=715481 RepID=UPI00351A01B1|nr:EF-hand domain [Trypanosoma melophagium]
MKNERPFTGAVSSYLEQHQVLLSEGMTSNKGESSVSGGNRVFTNNGSSGMGYHSGESGFAKRTPSPPTSYSGRGRPQGTSRYEGSDDWKQSPSYGGRRDGSHFRRSYGGYINGASYTRQGNDYGRSHSIHGVIPMEEGDLYHTELVKSEKEDVFRSSSVPTSHSESSLSLVYNKSSRSSTPMSGSNKSALNGNRVFPEIPLLLENALTEKQTSRVRTCLQNSTGSSQIGTKVKVLELLEYWMSDKATGEAIEALITEVFRKARFSGDDTDVGTKNNDGHYGGIGNMKGSELNMGARQPGEEERVLNSKGRSPSPSSSSSYSSSLSGTFTQNPSESRGANRELTTKQEQEQPQQQDQEQQQPRPRPEKQQELRQGSEEIRGFDVISKREDVITMSPRSNSPFIGGCLTAEEIVIAPSRPRPPKAPKSVPSKVLKSESSFSQNSTTNTATYEDIPRFYYPEGRPQLAEEKLVGPISKMHENPHLKLEEGMLIPTAVCTTHEDRAAVMTADTFRGRKAKSVPIAQLKAINDKDVYSFIQKEFSRLPSLPRHHQGTRPPKSVGKGVLGMSSSLQTRHGVNYRLQLTLAIQRICTRCFGLPKYFAFLIMKILQANTDYGNTSSKLILGNMPVSLSSSSLVSGSSSMSQIPSVTVEQLWGLFESHLRGRCILRRIFEMFLLSSRVLTNNPTTPLGKSGRLSETSVVEEELSPHQQLQQQQQQKQQQQKDRSYLLPEDFRAYIEILLEFHPGLAFLKQTPDFQSRYLETVIYRIFYDLDRFDRGRIAYAEMERSCFLDALRLVDATDDINSVLLYFSYEHFYVLYCRFWELDEDRDMLLSFQDFIKYAPEGVMNPIIAERTFTGVGRRRTCASKNRMNYEDFVWFCLSEEDKSTPTSIRYWFRILDLDGDGILSAYELHKFYDTTREIVLAHIPDGAVSVEDVICQIFDMFDADVSRGLRLSDLLSNPQAAAVALNMMTSVVRFLQFEQKDPLVAHQERLHGGLEQTPWDRFARAEYDRMSQETLSE